MNEKEKDELHAQQLYTESNSEAQQRSGSSNHPPSKRTRLQINSLGNKYKFQQQLKSSEACELVEKEPLTDQDAWSILNSCCCQAVNMGCLKAHFKTSTGETDLNAALTFVKSCREITASKDPTELDTFIKEQFYKSMAPKRNSEGKISTISMNYRLPFDRKVCKKAFAAAYGFSVYKLEVCSRLIKENPNERIGQIAHRQWKDDHIPDLTFRQMEEICRTNLGSAGDGCNISHPHIIQ